MFFVLNLLTKFTTFHQAILKKKLYAHKHTMLDHTFMGPVASHAFATPLMVILGNIEQALLDPRKNSTELMNNAYQAAKRIETLITTTINSHKRFDVKNSIERASIFSKSRYHTTIYTRFNYSKLRITGNEFLFEEAIVCLLNNAAESYNQQTNEKLVIIYSFVHNDILTIIIQDYGPGMNFLAQKIAVIRGISFRKNGHGLGIPFAMSVVDKHFQGTLSIRSKILEGTKIIIKIPLKL